MMPMAAAYLLLLLLLLAGAGSRAREGEAHGWTTVEADAPAACSDGSPFAFAVRHGTDSERAVLFFFGGGLCWNAESCFGGTLATPVPLALPTTAGQLPDDGTLFGGVLDFSHPDNPLANASFVVAPYCTGDGFLGNVSQTYGDRVYHHRGAANGYAATNYFLEHFSNASNLYVMGSSAGSIAAGAYSGEIARMRPDAQMLIVHDSTGGMEIRSSISGARIKDAWDAQTHARFPWLKDTNLDIENLDSASAPSLLLKDNPGVNVARFDYSRDLVIRWFLTKLGSSAGMLSGLPFALADAEDHRDRIFLTEGAIEDTTGREVISYVAPGTGHTALFFNSFYNLANDEDVRLVDWFTDLIVHGNASDTGCKAPASSC